MATGPVCGPAWSRRERQNRGRLGQSVPKAEVRSGGQVYTLDLRDRDEPWQVAETTDGAAVVVIGTLQGGRVIIRSLSPAPEFDLLEPAK